MSYVSELTETLRDSKISEPDHQAVLRSSATWLIGATKKPRLLWIPAFKLLFRGSSIVAECCEAGWGARHVDLWNRWREIPRNVLDGKS